jgi:ketosteroid isomerase-like protein
MSQENVEIVRQLLPPPDANFVTDVIYRGDEAGWKARVGEIARWFTDDFVGVGHAGASAISYRGLQAWRDAWLDWLEPWESYRAETQRVVDAGDRVFVHSRAFGRRPGMEAEIELPGASNVWTLRDRRVARLDHFTDETEALEAAGLPEQDAHADS